MCAYVRSVTDAYTTKQTAIKFEKYYITTYENIYKNKRQPTVLFSNHYKINCELLNKKEQRNYKNFSSRY